jgi:TolB-like protein
MEKLFAELKQRQMFRIAAAYVVLAWLLLQVVNNVAPVLDTPPWVARSFLLLLVIGFPVTLFFAWMRELPADSATAPATAGRLDWTLIGVLGLVVALISYQQLGRSPVAAIQSPPGATQTSASPNSISIAVLPFENLSDDREQEFFSDGMTAEINGALARVPNLQIVARSSAFQFKGQNQDVRMVGQALGATHLIEGSVRKAGDRVRISAQLVRADSGLQMWSENYDRQLTDIFAIQEEIAQAIAGALRARLLPGQQLVSNRTNDLDSYEQYLRAKALVRARGSQAMEQAIDLLEQVTARAPDYAPAWALLGEAYALMPQYYTGPRSDSVEEVRTVANMYLPKAQAAGQRAIELDPKNAEGYLSLGLVPENRGNYVLAEDNYSKALALDPNNPDLLHFYSGMLVDVGRVKESLAMRQRLQVLEPFVPVFVVNTALLYWVNGQDDAALGLARGLTPGAGGGGGGRAIMARIYASQGRYAEAADAVLELPRERETYSPEKVEAIARALRNIANAPGARQTLPPRLGNLSFFHFYIGVPEQAFEFYEEQVQSNFRNVIAAAWHPSYAPLRKTQRFKTLVTNLGFTDYWRARGWPDLCRPVGAEDFVCD